MYIQLIYRVTINSTGFDSQLTFYFKSTAHEERLTVYIL